ncbi:MAG: hypothetical protein IKJ73_10595 [Lachnospiraceae bacterium]|nr:hypothetical protein [Lachnospiraceae bacterium]
MMWQIKVLTKLELANMFSLNVLRHTKDKKARNTGIALGITIGFLMMLVIAYVGGKSYGFIKLGAEEIVPAYIVFMSSIFGLIFCAFKAGKIIFKDNCYDILASMPIGKTSIVVSRYIRLYAEGLVVSCLVMIPGIAVYGAMVRPGILAIVLGLASVMVVPIIPISLSVLLGVLITGISSRMKNKVLFETVFVVAIVVAVFAISGVVPEEDLENFDLQALGDIAKKLSDILHKVYPPTIWFGNAIGGGSILKFAMGTIVSVGILFIVISITAINFEKINRGLRVNTAKHNYKMGKLENRTIMKALVVREAKRYFSSGVYVTNTIIGPVMAVIFAVSLFFVDMNETLGGLPINIDLNGIIPVLFAGILGMNSPIATSVSMEGKEFWIIRTLPVPWKDVLKSKLLFSIMLLLPFYVVGEVVMVIALKPSIEKLVWMIILPATIIICILVVGLAVNLKFPKLKWDSEVEVVKQSASAMIGGLGGVLIALVAVIPLALVPENYYGLVACMVCIIVLTIAIITNHMNNKIDLKMLD